MTMFRFKVAQESMAPNLQPGDEFVATDSRPARKGEVVAVPHPEKTNFWMVKRLVAVGGEIVTHNGEPFHLKPGTGWVLSDNDAPGTIDSRSFGAVELASVRPTVIQLDSDSFAEAVALLSGEDAKLSNVVSQFGVPPFWSRRPGFSTLVLLILEQQVSLESGAAVFRRLLEFGEGAVEPEVLAAASVEALNALGLTRQKSGYVIDLARAVSSNDLDLDHLGLLSDGEALAALQALRGIGPWTAQAYLLSAERRPDLFPIGDRALQVGTAEALGTTSVPTGTDLELLAEPWRPIRSAAARIIWHGYLSRRGRVEPPDPFSAHRDPTKA